MWYFGEYSETRIKNRVSEECFMLQTSCILGVLGCLTTAPM
jgi:hypothetical protein